MIAAARCANDSQRSRAGGERGGRGTGQKPSIRLKQEL